MKKKLLISLIVGLFFVSSVFSAGDSTAVSDFSEGGRAVSLRVLQQKLKEYHGKRPFPEDLSQLCGINRIVGYVIDESNQDIILVGKVDKTLPALYLEDFVIAVRNAWFKYARSEGNTLVYSHPGCTIEPDPRVVQELDNIGNRIMKNRQSGEVEKEIKHWESTCKSPQKAEIMGVPFHTHFGWVMVKADYDMKRVVDGSDSLDIEGFASLLDTEFESAKKSILSGKPGSLHVSLMNRFWFYPGKNNYLEDEGVVVIDRCEVILLTEEEYLSKKGSIEGKGHPNPIAQRFAEEFSGIYSEIAKKRRIYSDLENLFRFVALAKILKFKSVPDNTGLDIDYLLEQYPVSRKRVDKSLPGRSNVKRFSHKKEHADGYQVFRLWLPSCGGVYIKIDVDQKSFKKERSRKLKNLQLLALKSRPVGRALSWDFKPGEGKPGISMIGSQVLQRLNEINRKNSKSYLTFLVADQVSRYDVHFDSEKPIFRGNDKSKLLQELKKVLARFPGVKIICLVLKDFKTKDKAQLFEFSLQYQRDKENLEPLIVVIPMNLLDILLLTPDRIEIVPKTQPSIEKVTEGMHRGWFRMTIDFFVKLSKKTREISINIYSRIRETLKSAFRELNNRISSPDPSRSLLRLINDSLREVLKGHKGMSFREIIIEIIEQIRDIDFDSFAPQLIKENRIIKAAA